MSGYSQTPAVRQMAEWFGPERVALVLSIIVMIAIALALRVGPFAPGSRSSPSGSPGPAPSVTGAASVEVAGLEVTLPVEAWPA